MSEWDFLWGLTGEALMDAMATGGTAEDWAYIEEHEGRQSMLNNKESRNVIRKPMQNIKKSRNASRKTPAPSVKKKNTLLLIDGENISYKRADSIMKAVKDQGVLYAGKVYGRQKDASTKGWSEKAKEYEIQDIRLYGKPQKDKADKKIVKDARKEVARNKNIDVVCIVTSDGGYVDTIKELRSQGKRVVIVGEKKAPEALRKACSRFIEICGCPLM